MAFGKKSGLSKKYEVNSGQYYDPKQREASYQEKSYQEKPREKEKPSDQEKPIQQETQPFQGASIYAGKINLATISLIAVFFFWPVGLILSIIALVQIKNDPSKKGKGVAALVLSLIYLVIAIFFTGGIISSIIKAP